MKTIEVKAKSLHEAIEDACEQLGVAQEDLDIEVLSQGGMFGKVKIKATPKPTAVKPAPKPEPVKEITVRPTTSGGVLDAREAVTPAPRTVRAERVPQAQVTNERVASAKPRSTGTSKFDATKNFVVKLLELMENDATVTTQDTDEAFNINVNGENIGRLIGKGGIVMSAIQTLVSSIAISNANGEGKRVFINIGDYKEKRGDTLQSLAMKKAEYVKKSGRYVKLEPMNPRDRAIIHTALANVEGVKTYSTGQGAGRCLCIAPADAQ